MLLSHFNLLSWPEHFIHGTQFIIIIIIVVTSINDFHLFSKMKYLSENHFKCTSKISYRKYSRTSKLQFKEWKPY